MHTIAGHLFADTVGAEIAVVSTRLEVSPGQVAVEWVHWWNCLGGSCGRGHILGDSTGGNKRTRRSLGQVRWRPIEATGAHVISAIQLTVCRNGVLHSIAVSFARNCMIQGGRGSGEITPITAGTHLPLPA